MKLKNNIHGKQVKDVDQGSHVTHTHVDWYEVVSGAHVGGTRCWMLGINLYINLELYRYLSFYD